MFEVHLVHPFNCMCVLIPYVSTINSYVGSKLIEESLKTSTYFYLFGMITTFTGESWSLLVRE